MEDFIQIIIYIAIFIIVSIIGVGKKRGKVVTTTKPFFPQNTDVFEEKPEEVFIPRQEVTVDKRDVDTPTIFPSESKSFDDILEKLETYSNKKVVYADKEILETISSEEGIPVFEETKRIMHSNNFFDENSISSSQISDEIIDNVESVIFESADFDLKKAIIYSEILKRKHFSLD